MQLIDYLCIHKLISIDQSAYLKLHSTQTALHRLIDDILENVNNKEITALCFLDIRKCFDTIDHKILLTKLYKYGIQNTELMWFKSYLADRKQVLYCNGASSTELGVNIGVPQGTVLGPILFLLYVNDLSNAVKNASINIYADDVVIYSSHENVDILKNQMQDTMNDVFKWYNENRLALSIEKCNTLVVHHNPSEPPPDIILTRNEIPLCQVKDVKYLGLTIDSKLHWNKHIASITKRVSMCNANLRRLHKYVPENILKKIYKATVEPIVDYASTVWGNTHSNLINTIHKLENRSARAIKCNYNFIDVRGDDLFADLNFTRFTARRNYSTAVLMYKAIHGLAPDYICNKIVFSYNRPQPSVF